MPWRHGRSAVAAIRSRRPATREPSGPRAPMRRAGPRGVGGVRRRPAHDRVVRRRPPGAAGVRALLRSTARPTPSARPPPTRQGGRNRSGWRGAPTSRSATASRTCAASPSTGPRRHASSSRSSSRRRDPCPLAAPSPASPGRAARLPDLRRIALYSGVTADRTADGAYRPRARRLTCWSRPRPITTWSSSSMPSSSPALATSLVRRTSSGDGVGSPDG